VDRVSDEELAAAMAANFDEDGNDLALARWVASMTPEERAQAEANLRACIAEARANLQPKTPRDAGDV
jgi:hypothetical protein